MMSGVGYLLLFDFKGLPEPVMRRVRTIPTLELESKFLCADNQ